MKTSFILLFFVVAYVYTLPINCSSGAEEMDSGVDGLSFSGSLITKTKSRKIGKTPKKSNNFFGSAISKSSNNFFTFFKNFKIWKLNPICRSKDVCVVDCSKVVEGCNKAAFFTDFTQNAQGTERQVFKAYMDACIYRKFDGPREKNPIKSYLQLKLYGFSFTFTKTFQRSSITYGEILDKIEKSNDPILKYLGKMSELMLTFQRMCTEDENWRENVEQKVNELFDFNTEDIEVQFSGNTALREYFVDQVAQLAAIKRQMIVSNLFGNNSLYTKFNDAVNAFKMFFVGLITKNDFGYVCKCENFMKNNNLFPNGQKIAEDRCNVVCSTNSNTVLEELIYEE
eukprot:gene1434-12053_t